ncbi:MAG TPA: Uma2 family endonuclease, partial [Bryobacteraceae bacterium]|nr:Uma2 family endonuclease [Bryobacteraceae bacterium]
LKGVPYVEMRVQVGATRFRVPDICFSFEEGFPEILREPPFLVIEILSSEDRVSRLLSRLADYENFGVPFIFVVDPFERQAYRFQSHGLQPITDGVLRTSDPEIVVDIHERFRAIYGQ